ADARRSLLGHLGTAVWSVLLYLFIQLFLSGLLFTFPFKNPLLQVLSGIPVRYLTLLFCSLFGIGLSSVFLNLQYGQQASVRDLFFCFRENPDKSVRIRAFVTAGELVSLLPLQVLVNLPSETPLTERLPLLTAAGLVSLTAYAAWTTTYSMVNFLMLDFPQADAGRILRTSRSMMRGSRIRLLLLYLRVLPLHLLGLFSFGLANLWAGSCRHACAAAFYRDMMSRE
ncbi:MAG: DUF975 family protein, partial [Eubacteriales bacterium]|nr:DUF975 family protein [Eubacteriales bacterium]